jgi:hypothetical protein
MAPAWKHSLITVLGFSKTLTPLLNTVMVL